MLNLQKLEKLATLSFENALRLHYDAILLYEKGSYPSAFQLSILSQEEIGKMHIVNDFVWHSKVDGRMLDFEKTWLDLLYKHPTKQYAFQKSSPLSNPFSHLMEEISKGSLEVKKQSATYVGFGRRNGKILTKGKIKHPFLIGRNSAKEQITKINDYLLVTGVGIRFGQYTLDNEQVENRFKNKRHLNSLHKSWPHMSGQAIRWTKRFQKFFKETVISL